MKTMIYRNRETTTFTSCFLYEAEQMANKLTFITKDEYLVWVKKWKEDFKIVERQHRIEKYTSMRDNCVLQTKIDYYQKKLDKVEDLTLDEATRYNVLMFEMQQYSGMNHWFKCGYWLAVYYLVQRKASKLRAAAQWKIAKDAQLLATKT